MSGLGENVRTGTVVGGAAACLLALALACSLPVGTARAEHLPDGTGDFDVSVTTDVLPAIDPNAVLCDVAIHVANDAGEHVEAVQVDIVVVPPNAESYQPDAPDASDAGEEARPLALASSPTLPGDDPRTTVAAPGPASALADGSPGTSHAVSATGSTSVDGRVLLPNAAVGATYKVFAVKDGHEDYEGQFTCAGADGETWEVRLNRIPEELPSGSAAETASGASLQSAAGGTDASLSADGASSMGGTVAMQHSGHASPVRGFVRLLVDAFPYWLIIVAVFALGSAGLLAQANRVRKEGGEDEWAS